MKSVEMIVPRDLIQKFYQHPEPIGDGAYVVDLINGMFTDVFYREEGDFVTITNDRALISYLKKNETEPREYLFRNGVFSLRQVQDCDRDCIIEWQRVSPLSLQQDLPHGHNLPTSYMFCFYWIEVGTITIKEDKLILDVYEIEFIQMIDLNVAMDLIVEYLKSRNSEMEDTSQRKGYL